MLPARWAEPIAWIAITLVPVLEYGHYVMSEIPYLLFSLLALEAYDRVRGRGRGGARGVALAAAGAALAAAATFYTRSVGLSLWAALGIALLLDRGVSARPRGVFFGLSAALFVPWALRSFLGPPNPYFRQLVQVNPFHPEWGLLGFDGWLRRIAANLQIYGIGEIPTALFPIRFRSTYAPPELRYEFLPWFIGSIPLLLVGIGLVRSLRRREPLGVYLLLYFVVNLLWPRLWTGLRFLVPVLPLYLLLLFDGLLFLFGLSGKRLPRRRGIAAALVGLWLVLAVRNQTILAREARAYPPEWDAYFRAAEWIRTQTPRDALVVDRKPAMLAYVADRKVVGFPREGDPDRMIDWMEEAGVDLVVVPPLPYDDIIRYLIPAVAEHQHRFEPLFEIEEPYTVVLRLREPLSRSSPGG